MNETTTFDPSKKYTWQAEDKIQISGAEFGTIYNSLSNFIAGNITNTSTIIMLAEAFAVMQSKFIESVNGGIFVEATEEIQS